MEMIVTAEYVVGELSLRPAFRPRVGGKEWVNCPTPNSSQSPNPMPTE